MPMLQLLSKHWAEINFELTSWRRRKNTDPMLQLISKYWTKIKLESFPWNVSHIHMLLRRDNGGGELKPGIATGFVTLKTIRSKTALRTGSLWTFKNLPESLIGLKCTLMFSSRYTCVSPSLRYLQSSFEDQN